MVSSLSVDIIQQAYEKSKQGGKNSGQTYLEKLRVGLVTGEPGVRYLHQKNSAKPLGHDKSSFAHAVEISGKAISGR